MRARDPEAAFHNETSIPHMGEKPASRPANAKQNPRMRHCSDSLRAWFSGLLRRFDRIVIVGPPKCGKSTLANEVSIDDRPVLRSDDFKKHSWEDTPAEIIKAANMAGPKWTFEGVMGARALRKGLDAQAVVYLTKPRAFQVPGQIAMGKGIATVMQEWRAKDGGKTPVFYAPEDTNDESTE